MRWFKSTAALLALILLFSSCIKVDGKIKIEDDGSGTVDFLTALNADVLTDVLGESGFSEGDFGTQDEICSDFEADMGNADDAPAGATVTPYDEDGFCGARVQYALSASTDHSSQITDLFEDDARLYKEGDNWFFETGFSTDDITADTSDAPQAMIDALFGEASFVITVDLPGKAVEGANNATSVGSDGLFTWDIDVFDPPARFFAQTEPGSGGGSGGGGFNPLLIVGLVALLAALGAAGYWFMNKKDGGDGAADLASSQPGMTPSGAYDPTASQAGMAVSDLPPAATTVMPTQTAASVQETVIINQQDLAAAAAATPAAEAVAQAASNEPVWDEALGAWVVHDATRGRLRHDPATDTWNPA